ncbi:hypothetical protein ACX6XY_14005 [Streptomyces sp. O3]
MPDRGRQPYSWGALFLLGGATVLALALLTGRLVLFGSGSEPEPGPDPRPPGAQTEDNREPFERAVAELEKAAGIRYTTLSGMASQEITVTEFGTKFGSVAYGDGEYEEEQRLNVLHIGDDTSTWGNAAPQHSPGPTQHSTGPKQPFQGAHRALDQVLDQYLPPRALAPHLSSALRSLDRLPDSNDPLIVDEGKALRTDTMAGRLVVTRQAPYRVLRLEPYEDPYKVAKGPLSLGDSPGIKLTPIAEERADAMYSHMEKYAHGFDRVAKESVVFVGDGAAEVDCGVDSCSVTQTFIRDTAVGADSRITNGIVTAILTATVLFDGEAAEECTSDPYTVQLTDGTASVSLSCDIPDSELVSAGARAGSTVSVSALQLIEQVRLERRNRAEHALGGTAAFNERM